MASSPFCTHRMGFGMPAFANARRINVASFSSSSTTRMVSCGFFMVRKGLLQLDPEGTALARLRLHAICAAQPFHSFRDDCQADPRAGVGARRLQPFKDLENSFVVLPRD